MGPDTEGAEHCWMWHLCAEHLKESFGFWLSSYQTSQYPGKNWFWIWTVIVHEFISQEWNNATCRKGADVLTMSSGCRARIGNWEDILPEIPGVCRYKNGHEQRCSPFSTLRQGLEPGFALFAAWLWAAGGAGRGFVTPLSPPGCCSCCDDGLGPPSFDDRAAFCLFSLITVVWGCYLCVLSSGMIVLNVASFSWYLL